MNKKLVYGWISVLFFAVFMAHSVRILLNVPVTMGGISLALPLSILPVIVSIIILNEVYEVKNRFWVMGEKTLDTFTFVVLSLVALFHLARLFTGFSVVIGGLYVPLWASFVGFFLSFTLAFIVAGFIGKRVSG